MAEAPPAEAPPAEAPPDEDLESSEEHLYFLAIEKVFIEERGAPLFLSPKDWQVARKWYEEGIPLDWVERTLRELFEKRRARGTVKKVLSLNYCRRSIEAAWNRFQKMEAPDVAGTVPEIDVPARLAALAGALPAHLDGLGAWQERLSQISGRPEEVEEKLQKLDRKIFKAASRNLAPDVSQKLDEDLEKALARVARRLGEKELRGARERLRERLWREHLQLPVLSLFAPEATS